MQSSYKIIKNNNISYGDKGISVSNIKLSTPIETSVVECDTKKTLEEDIDEIDTERIRVEITKELYIKNEHERQKIIATARQEATKIADEIKEQAKEEGLKEGYEEGYKKGIEDCKTECDEMKSSALSLIDQAKEEVEEYLTDSKDSIIRLAGDMAEKIVNTTIDLSSENILMLIKPIINLNERNELIVISCHPDNFDFLKQSKPILKLAAPNARFVLLSDNSLEKNGCIIENENQIIDLQIKKQIDAIINDIKNLEV